MIEFFRVFRAAWHVDNRAKVYQVVSILQSCGLPVRPSNSLRSLFSGYQILSMIAGSLLCLILKNGTWRYSDLPFLFLFGLLVAFFASLQAWLPGAASKREPTIIYISIAKSSALERLAFCCGSQISAIFFTVIYATAVYIVNPDRGVILLLIFAISISYFLLSAAMRVPELSKTTHRINRSRFVCAGFALVALSVDPSTFLWIKQYRRAGYLAFENWERTIWVVFCVLSVYSFGIIASRILSKKGAQLTSIIPNPIDRTLRLNMPQALVVIVGGIVVMAFELEGDFVYLFLICGALFIDSLNRAKCAPYLTPESLGFLLKVTYTSRQHLNTAFDCVLLRSFVASFPGNAAVLLFLCFVAPDNIWLFWASLWLFSATVEPMLVVRFPKLLGPPEQHELLSKTCAIMGPPISFGLGLGTLWFLFFMSFAPYEFKLRYDLLSLCLGCLSLCFLIVKKILAESIEERFYEQPTRCQ